MSDRSITADDLEAFVRLWLREEKESRDKSKSRKAIDAAMAICLEAGELDLAASLMFVQTARVVDNQHDLTGLLMQFHYDRNSPIVTRLIEAN
jgi:hypothetical protein